MQRFNKLVVGNIVMDVKELYNEHVDENRVEDLKHEKDSMTGFTIYIGFMYDFKRYINMRGCIEEIKNWDTIYVILEDGTRYNLGEQILLQFTALSMMGISSRYTQLNCDLQGMSAEITRVYVGGVKIHSLNVMIKQLKWGKELSDATEQQ